MRLFVAVTDSEWFGLHASKSQVDEVNFWRPSPEATFKALQPGELLLFKLHSPDAFGNLVWPTSAVYSGPPLER